MGNNSAYTIFEATVIGAYNLGKLDKMLLGVLMKPYRNCDIDSGGSHDLTAKDGFDVEDAEGRLTVTETHVQGKQSVTRVTINGVDYIPVLEEKPTHP